MEPNMKARNESEPTTIGGRFIAGFAITGLTLALIVSTWSIRSAEPQAATDEKAATVTTTASTSPRERKTSEETTTSQASPSKRTSRESQQKSSVNDPFLPPHAWKDNGKYTVKKQSQEPTAMWLAEPGKEPQRHTFGGNSNHSKNPTADAPSNSAQSNTAQAPNSASQASPQQDNSTDYRNPNNWPELTSLLPEDPQSAVVPMPPKPAKPHKPSDTSGSSVQPTPIESQTATNNGNAGQNDAGQNNNGRDNAGQENSAQDNAAENNDSKEPTSIKIPTGNQKPAQNIEDIVPDSGTFLDDLDVAN